MAEITEDNVKELAGVITDVENDIDSETAQVIARAVLWSGKVTWVG